MTAIGMDLKNWRLVLALILGIAGIFLLMSVMGSSGILPAPLPLMPN